MATRGFSDFRRVTAMFIAAAIIAFSGTASGNASDRVIIGTPGGYSDSSIAVKLALERGFFKDAGLDVEVIDFKGGAPAVQALVGGGINYCICAPEHVVRMRNRGIDGYVVFALDTHHTYVLIGKGSSTAKNLADLKGRRVGITSSGSLTESLIRLEALRENLDPDTDIGIVGSGVGAAMKAAIDSGRIEAGMFGNLEAETLIAQGYRVVFDWRPQEIPSLALLSTGKQLHARPEIAKAFTRAVARAQALILDDQAVALEYLAAVYPTLSRDVLAADAANLPHRLSRDGVYSEAAMDRLQQDLRALEPDLKPVSYAQAMPKPDVE